MRKIYVGILSILSLSGFAQLENSSFTNAGRGCATTFATDYEAVGINPANVGWASKYEDKKFAMGFAEYGVSIYSQALTKDQLRNTVFGLIQGKHDTLSYNDKINAVKIDCEENKELCNKFKIEYYPTIKLIHKNNVYEYTGKHDEEAIMDFVTNKY